MANPPYFPLYPQDFLGKTSRLSNEKFGAYCRLLFNSWLEPLVDDMDELTQITRQDVVKTRQLLEKYFVLENGIWINRRMEKERVKAEDKIAKATAAANARWNANGNADADADAYAGGYATGDATGDAQGDATAMPSQNSDLRTKKEELKTQNPEPKSQKKEEPPISPQRGSVEFLEISLAFHEKQQADGLSHQEFKHSLSTKSKIVVQGAEELAKLNRIDGESVEDIRRVLKFILNDNGDDNWAGWKAQVVSLAQIRKKSRNGNTKYFNAKNALKKQARELGREVETRPPNIVPPVTRSMMEKMGVPADAFERAEKRWGNDMWEVKPEVFDRLYDDYGVQV